MSGLIQDIKLIGDEVAWLKSLRDEGKNSFAFPTVKSENWKYTKVHSLMKETFTPSHYANVSASKINLDSYQIHFINGFFNPINTNLPDDVEVVPLIEKLIEGEGCQCHAKVKKAQEKIINLSSSTPFVALNSVYLQEGIFIKINKTLDKPIVLINHTKTDENFFYNLRNIIILEENASAELLEIYTYEGKEKTTYFGNHVNEITINKDAKLNHYKLQSEAFYAYHLAFTNVDIKENGEYNNFCLQKGANLGRNEIHAKLLEENARANINAAYIMNGWATLDTTANIEHLSPKTYSDVFAKGVVGGNARGVFQGKIHIAKNAVHTEGKQLHKALLLSDTAEIDCKPELEIFADDVKCSHGAATGELDKNQIFYMQSRGILEDIARQILIDAYLDDVFEKIENPKIKDWIKNNV